MFFALSKFVNVNTNQIRVLKVSAGSIIIELELPVTAADHLFLEYQKNNNKLGEFRIIGVELGEAEIEFAQEAQPVKSTVNSSNTSNLDLLDPSYWLAEFIERLLACPSLETAAGRRGVISMLPPDLGHSIADQNETGNRVAVTALAGACLRYGGGVGVLLERLRFFDTGKSGMQALETFLAGQPVPPSDAFPVEPPSASAVINNSGGVNISGGRTGPITYTDYRGATVVQPPAAPKRSPFAPPDAPRKFAGRVRELAALEGALRAGEGGKVALTAVRGQGGIGKTTLARQLAFELWKAGPHRLFEVVLWVEVKPNPDRWPLLRRWAGLCEVAVGDNQPDWDGVAEGVRAAFEGLIAGRTLVVFDDVWPDGVETVRELLKAVPSRASVLVTSRDSSVGVALAASPLEVGTLPTPEAVALLLEYLDDKGLPQTGLEELAKVLKGHALALTLAAKRLNKEGGAALPRHLKQYAEGLPTGSAVSRLKVSGKLTGREDSLELALAYSYEGLNPVQQTRFRALGVLAYDQPFDLRLLAGLWAIPAEDAEEADETAREWAGELAELSLVEGATETELGDGWYRQHPILHAYALALLKADPTEYAADRDRYHDRSIVIAYKFRELQDKPEEWKPLDPYLPHIHGTGDELAARYQSQPTDESTARRALDFASNIYPYLHYRQEVHKLEWLAMGLVAAQSLQDRQRQGLFLNELGLYYDNRGEGAKALEYYEPKLVISRELGDRGGEATTLSNMGSVYDDLGDKPKALQYYEQALPLRRQVGDRSGEAATLNNMGLVYSALGDKPKALDFFGQALPFLRLVGDRGGEATTLSNMGLVYSDLGDKSKALQYYEQALPLLRQVGDRGGEATTLNNMGGVYFDLGEGFKALQYYEQALPLVRQVGDRSGEANTLNNMGVTLWEMGKREDGLQLVERAQALLEAVRSPNAQVSAGLAAQMREELGQGERPRYWARRYRHRRG